MDKLFPSLLVALLLMPQALGAATFKIATVAPEGTSWMRAMRAGAEEIEQRTEGRVEFRFYGGGVMGDEPAVLRKMRFGQLQGGAFTGGGAALMQPDVRIYGLPLLFRDHAEVDHLRAELDAEIYGRLEEAGYVTFGFASGGFAMLMSQSPVSTLDDVRGRKLWVPEGDEVLYESMQELGLSPVTLPLTDVLTGLQTELIEAVGVSPLGAVAFQWHTQVQHVTDYPLVYLVGTMIVDKRPFDRLSAEDQAVVREVWGRVYAEFDGANRADDLEATAALRDQGLTFHPIEDDVDAWRERLDGVFLRLGEEGVFDVELYQRALEVLEAYRVAGGAGGAEGASP